MDNDEDAAMTQHIAQYTADWERLWGAARGQDVVEVERLIRDWAETHAPWVDEVDVVFMARVMSNAHWFRKHSLSAVALAWKHRRSRPPHRSLLWLWRPRFAG